MIWLDKNRTRNLLWTFRKIVKQVTRFYIEWAAKVNAMSIKNRVWNRNQLNWRSMIGKAHHNRYSKRLCMWCCCCDDDGSLIGAFFHCYRSPISIGSYNWISIVCIENEKKKQNNTYSLLYILDEEKKTKQQQQFIMIITATRILRKFERK